MPPAPLFPPPSDPRTSVGALWRGQIFDGVSTGVLDISLPSRRVLSIPSQLGCRIGCTFCVSNTAPLVRNLRLDELQALVGTALDAAPEDGRPLELSFTGEGEPLLNWRNTEALCEWARASLTSPLTVRYAASGLALDRLLHKVHAAELPLRLQFSLHAARQDLRDRLVPQSLPLAVVRRTLLAQQSRFVAVGLNVVLQDGVNDSDADLAALLAFVAPGWTVLLNPLLTDGREVVARRTGDFENALRLAGVPVKRFEAVARRISRGGLYPLLRMSRICWETSTLHRQDLNDQASGALK